MVGGPHTHPGPDHRGEKKTCHMSEGEGRGCGRPVCGCACARARATASEVRRRPRCFVLACRKP